MTQRKLGRTDAPLQLSRDVAVATTAHRNTKIPSIVFVSASNLGQFPRRLRLLRLGVVKGKRRAIVEKRALVDDDVAAVEMDQPIVRSFMRSWNMVFGLEVERHLVRQRALDVKRDAAPGSGDRPVQMAHEHVIGPSGAGDDLPFRLAVGELDGVHVA